MCRHQDARSKIVGKRVEMVPEDFKDASALLEFAIALGSSGKGLTGMRMLRHVKEGISKAEVKLRVDADLSMLDASAEARKEFARIGA